MPARMEGDSKSSSNNACMQGEWRKCEIAKRVCIKGMEKHGHEVQASYKENHGVRRQFLGRCFDEAWR